MRLVFFNHKGGVSKTTTTFHLGWKLAEHGYKVLLVDADSQCNLTGLIMGDDFERFYIDNETKDNNLMGGVNPAFQSRPEPIEAIDCYNIERNPNLFLLAGHPNLTELEPQLSFAQTTQNAFTTMQNLPGAFNALIDKTSEKYEIDIVLIDVNPSLSAINQNLFSISDVFAVPTNPDPFSLMAINTLTDVLPRWKNSAEQMKESFKEASYPFPDRNQKFGGIIIQRFNIRKGKPSAPFKNNMDEIMENVRTKLVPNLEKHDMLFEKEVYKSSNIPDDYCITEIPDFQSLLPQSHLIGVPVFVLNDDEINKTGTVLEQMIKSKNNFNEMFEQFAEKIEKLKKNAGL